jgi:hypothetical protein
MKRRDTIVTALTVLAIAATIPFAIQDIIETGRVYLCSRQFFEELPHRFTGPGRFRFVLQPTIAILLGVRRGLADARAGNPRYGRKELLLSGVAAVSTLLALGVIMDIVFQFVVYKTVHPGVALLVGPIFIFAPYVLSRELTTHLATRWGRK